MSHTRRLSELQALNVLFCLLVVFIHTASHPVAALDRMSWQYAVVLACQRLSFVAVYGFYLLSGVKLTLPQTRPASMPAYWKKRAKSLLLPYVIAVGVYYAYFLWRQYFPFSLRELLGYLVRGDLSSPFYFLIALFQFILLAPLFLWLADRWSPLALLPLSMAVTWLSTAHLEDIVRVFAPGASFAYGDRVFTTYLFFFLAGCCIGAHYERFPAFLEKNRPLLYTASLLFAAADAVLSVLAFSGRRAVPFLAAVHLSYIAVAVFALFDLALRRRAPLPPLALRIDRASFLIYLYHCLTITVLNGCAARLGVTRVGALFLLRVLVTYTVTIALCVGWQTAARALKSHARRGENRNDV